MKVKHLFLPLMAALAMTGCSSDEQIQESNLATADEAYMTIRLVNNSKGIGTRGTAGNPEFEDGTGNETESGAKNVDFYFYSEGGTFNQMVTKEVKFSADAPANDNVEVIGKETVVLQNLQEAGIPKYVVAVLNGATGAYKGMTLKETHDALVNSYNNGQNFIMTNSTFVGEATDVDQKYFFATTINKNNILAEKPEKTELTKANAVNIYVERLACKVGIGFGNGLTVIENNKISLGKINIDGAEQDLTLEILAWGLNAKNRTSYVGKHINSNWPTTFGNLTWNDADHHRSYWAKSPNYGAGPYPASYASTKEPNATSVDETILEYVTWESLNKTMNQTDYCLENTNTPDIIKSYNYKAAITHVLLKAQTTSKVDLVRYLGQLYTRTGFLNIVLSQLNMNAYYKEGDAYKQIEATHITEVNAYDGRVNVGLTEAAKGMTWYTKDGDTYAATTTADMQSKIDALNIKADYYKSGMMYYCIPIEHLAGGQATVDAEGKATVQEADYGVVRNHWYKLTINKIANLGTSVYDPTEEIIPNVETPTYYIGATINILAWKVVTQQVEL